MITCKVGQTKPLIDFVNSYLLYTYQEDSGKYLPTYLKMCQDIYSDLQFHVLSSEIKKVFTIDTKLNTVKLPDDCLYWLNVEALKQCKKPDGTNHEQLIPLLENDNRNFPYIEEVVAVTGCPNPKCSSDICSNVKSITSVSEVVNIAGNDYTNVTKTQMLPDGSMIREICKWYPVFEKVNAGQEWVAREAAVNNSWQSVVCGNGIYVAVGTSGSGNRVMTSPDGITWTSRTSAADNSWMSVTYYNGLFVAVSTSGTGNRVMTSVDGITWVIRTSAADNAWNSITYGNGLFVAVSSSGTGNRVMTSPDGITWTSRTSAADNSWQSVIFANNIFVAVAITGTGNRVMTSPDGITWTIRTSAADNSWQEVTFGNELFVAVARTGTTNRVMTSPDGITWTIQTAINAAWFSVTFGNGLFVAVSHSTDIMVSYDGITWTSATAPQNYLYESITFGNGTFVAIASFGAEERVMTSVDTTYILKDVENKCDTQQLCKLDLDEDKCVVDTPANVVKIKNCCTCFDTCCDKKHDLSLPTINVHDGIIYFSNNHYPKILLTYKTSGINFAQETMIPTIAEQAMIAGLAFNALKYKKNVSTTEKEMARAYYNMEKNKLVRVMFPLRIQELINAAHGVNPIL